MARVDGQPSPNPIKVANLVSVSAITVIPPLTFTASSDNTAVATATISGKNLLVTGHQPATAHVMAKATDLDGASVSQTFTVTVTIGPARLANISTRGLVGRATTFSSADLLLAAVARSEFWFVGLAHRLFPLV